MKASKTFLYLAVAVAILIRCSSTLPCVMKNSFIENGKDFSWRPANSFRGYGIIKGKRGKEYYEAEIEIERKNSVSFRLDVYNILGNLVVSVVVDSLLCRINHYGKIEEVSSQGMLPVYMIDVPFTIYELVRIICSDIAMTSAVLDSSQVQGENRKIWVADGNMSAEVIIKGGNIQQIKLEKSKNKASIRLWQFNCAVAERIKIESSNSDFVEIKYKSIKYDFNEHIEDKEDNNESNGYSSPN